METFPERAKQFAQKIRMVDVDAQLAVGNVAVAKHLCLARVELLTEVIDDMLQAIPGTDRPVDDLSAYLESIHGTPTPTEWLDDLEAHYNEQQIFKDTLNEIN